MARRKVSSEDIKNKVLNENTEKNVLKELNMTEEDLENMTEEEFEQLDEVSKEKLQRYVKAVGKEKSDLVNKSDWFMGNNKDPYGNYMPSFDKKKFDKRHKGDILARSKYFKKTGKKLDFEGDEMKESISLSEDDLKSLFGENAETLTEEFRTKVTTLFEAAVNDKVIALTENYEEQYETALNEEVTEIYENLVNKLDEYVTYIAEDWMKQNEVAIESAVRAELAEDLMTGIRNVFLENNIDIPEDKVDVVEELTRRLEETENKLNEAIDHNIELQGMANEYNRKAVFDEVSEGLSLTQKEKLATLSESIEFDDKFNEKLNIIKEKYFTKASPKKESNILTESFEGNTKPQKKEQTEISQYAKFISKTSKI